MGLEQFVTVHQQLLNIIIGNAGLLNDIPLIGAPVAQVLRSLEGVVDVSPCASTYTAVTKSLLTQNQAIALGLLAACPDVSSALSTQHGQLDVTINLAIDAYAPAV